jgi:protein-tyrosine phosphatase
MPPFSVDLEHASNLRDLGGWTGRDGRVVRRGLVFRAPALVGLSAADGARVAALGLRTVCDLRGTRERAAAPVGLAGIRDLSLPIEPSVGASLKDILRTGQVSGHFSASDMRELLTEAYRAYALQSHPQYRALFAEILAPEGLPLLLHCSAGKDRTGFGSALLLTALGVGWDDVVRDYLATNDLWKREIASRFDLPADVKEVLLGAHEDLLVAAFDAIGGTYGSVDAYLAEAIGLDMAARARLDSLLLG